MMSIFFASLSNELELFEGEKKLVVNYSNDNPIHAWHCQKNTNECKCVVERFNLRSEINHVFKGKWQSSEVHWLRERMRVALERISSVMTDLINMCVLDLVKVLCVILHNVKDKVIPSTELIMGIFLLSSVNTSNVYNRLLIAQGQTNNDEEKFFAMLLAIVSMNKSDK